MANDPEFRLGLVMAGAVSAGAYSAGVVDFLVEALDEYETCRTTGKMPDGTVWDGPTHRVRVPVMAGASAGGMTAAMAALQLFGTFDHVRPGKPPPQATANRLYASWVDEIDIGKLLATDDASGDDALRSLLCSSELEAIVKRTLDARSKPHTRAWVGSGTQSVLTLLLTISNTGGVPYRFAVQGGAAKDDGYGMLNHGDDLRFVVGAGGLGGGAPGYQVIDLANLDDAALGRLGAAALATGAFPLGFAARPISRSFGDYGIGDRVGYDELRNGELVFTPVGPVTPPPTGSFGFVAVDGGVIDNEPFELARRFLSPTSAPNPLNRDGARTTYAVLLVDPFPNVAAWPDTPQSDTLVAMVKPLLSMLIDQARFKPQELSLALKDSVFSRFAILPKPVAPGQDAQQLAIASGAMGGFSGFLHHSYRRHDYLLGMRNAQAFLRWHLNLPQSNPIFSAWKDAGGDVGKWAVRDPPAGRPGASIAAEADRGHAPTPVSRTVDGPPDDLALPIIPLTPRLLAPIEIGPADMPKPGLLDMAKLEARVSDRVKAVTRVLIDRDLKEYVPGYGYGGATVAKWVIPPKLTELAMKGIREAQGQITRAFP